MPIATGIRMTHGVCAISELKQKALTHATDRTNRTTTKPVPTPTAIAMSMGRIKWLLGFPFNDLGNINDSLLFI